MSEEETVEKTQVEKTEVKGIDYIIAGSLLFSLGYLVYNKYKKTYTESLEEEKVKQD